MATLLSFEVRGWDRTVAGLAALRARVQDLTPFWRDVFAPKYFGEVQDRFALQGQRRDRGTGQFSAGARWEPLSPAYARWKARHFPGKKILERTGRLRGSLRWAGNQIGPEGIFEATATHALVGTSVPYGKHHQTGTRRMPVRRFLDPPDPEPFAALLKAWLLREMKA